MRRTAPAVALTALALAACHNPRPQTVERATSTPAPVASPTPAPVGGVDPGPVEPWYRQNVGRIGLDPAAEADSLTLSLSLLEWIGTGSEAAWERIAARVEAAFKDPTTPLRLAFKDPPTEEAARYHAAAEPLSAKPQAERDPTAEMRLYQKALLLNPVDPDLSNHVAIAFSLAKDYRQAERYAKVAIAIVPGYISAYQELAYVYKNQERYREAVAVADRGLNVDGDLHVKALLLARKGQAYWMLGEGEEAQKAFQGSKRLGGPAWIDSYLEGKQELGKPYRE